MRFPVAWRHGDDQPIDLAVATKLEVIRDRLMVPIGQKRRVWIDGLKGSLGEACQVIAQAGLKQLAVVIGHVSLPR